MHLSNSKRSFLFIILLLIAGQTFSQDNITPVEKQARELSKYFANQAGARKLFTPAFLKKVSAEKLEGILETYNSNYGAFVKLALVKQAGNYSAKYDFIFDKNLSVPVNITVEQNEPYLIDGLFFGNPALTSANFTELINELKKLPGTKSLLAVKLNNSGIEPVAEYNAEEYLAIGSSFKLYILSEVLRTINSGERKWTDIVELKKEAVSLPSGILHLRPAGSKVRLDSLAALMISISDNTAADNLLFLAGRENVEKMLSTAGHSKPKLNIPFLATMEMFKMKGDPAKKIIADYLLAKDKRKFLTDELVNVKRENFRIWKGPFFIKEVEWFASAKDLCNVMNWLRINSDNEKDNRARYILSINPGTTISKDKWNFVGYKGGSEPGVINMTYLLRSSKGEWFALSCGWNDTSDVLNDSKFISIVGRAIQLLEN